MSCSRCGTTLDAAGECPFCTGFTAAPRSGGYGEVHEEDRSPDWAPAGAQSADDPYGRAAGSDYLERLAASRRRPIRGGMPSRPTRRGPLAPVGARVIAAVIDWVLTLLVGVGVAVPLGASVTALTRNTSTFAFTWGALTAVLVASLVVTVAGALNQIVGVALRGQTVGKWAMSIRVVRDDGAPCGWGIALGRWASREAFSRLFGIGGSYLLGVAAGYLAVSMHLSGGGVMFLGIAMLPLTVLLAHLDSAWAFTDRENQALHDKVVHTVVVHR